MPATTSSNFQFKRPKRKIKINTGNTAIRRNCLSRPIKDYIDNFSIPKDYTIFDNGCGYGNDAKQLKSYGYNITAWDPNHDSDRGPKWNKHFNLVTCIYVLNIIPDVKDRIKTINNSWNRVKPGGILYIAVRSKEDIDKSRLDKPWKRHKDGWITSKNSNTTFQKGFTDTELQDIIKKSIDNYGDIQTKSSSKGYMYCRVAKKAV